MYMRCILNAIFLSGFGFFFLTREIEIRSDMCYGSLVESEKLTLTQQYIMLCNRG